MPTDVDPIVDNWYQHLGKGQKFKVVALDDATAAVEIQCFDGTLEEIELDAWYQLEVEPIEEPEDWTGSLDDVEHDALGSYSESGMGEEDWEASSREIKPEPDTGTFKETENDWGEAPPTEEPWEGE
jgi:hypothetical protein